MNINYTIPEDVRKQGLLCKIPDEVQMTREYFAALLKRFRHYRNISIGFSTKHTDDIMTYRKKVGADDVTLPSNLYSFPVEWNTEVTYIK